MPCPQFFAVLVFSSAISEHLVHPPLEKEIVEFQGKFYSVSGERLAYMRDKSQNEHFFILTLFAIAKELEYRGEMQTQNTISLAVGLPLEHFGRQRESFRRYFLREDTIRFVYKDTALCITIEDVSVFTQAHAAVAPIFNEIRQLSTAFIIDIGGMTTDVLLLRNGRPDIKYCRSLEIGIITMNNNLIGKINAQHDMMIDDAHILSVLQGKESILPGDVRDTIHNAAKQHAQGTLDKLRELNIDLKVNPSIFIGGESILLRPYIEQSDKVAAPRFMDDVKANAIGYNLLMEAKRRGGSA